MFRQFTSLHVHFFQDIDSLRKVKTSQSVARREHWYDNTAVVVLGAMFAVDKGLSKEERKLVQALGKKYDAARDKLLIEVNFV